MRARSMMLVGMGMLAGCLPAQRDDAYVSAELTSRVGYGLRASGASPTADAAVPRERPFELPPGVTLDDGISEDDAIALALWNNAPFHEALADLGFSRADLLQAGLLRNPVFSVLYPLGPKQLEFTFTLPLEALWLRPKRVAIATLDAAVTAERLIQRGLDLTRDVRLAWNEAVFTTRRSELAAANAAISERVSGIAAARLRAGDASELDATNARAEALMARQDAARLDRDRLLAHERLRAVLGMDVGAPVRVAADASFAPDVVAERSRLIAMAYAARPDVRAAEIGIERAGERAGLSRWEAIAIAGIADANRTVNGIEMGPGTQLTLPIFDWNQGGRARAEAELTRSIRQYATLRQQIAFEVATAMVGLEAAAREAAALAEGAVPASEAAERLAESAYRAGEVSMLPVLDAKRRSFAVHMRRLEAERDVARSRAELERTIGQRTSALPKAERPAA